MAFAIAALVLSLGIGLTLGILIALGEAEVPPPAELLARLVQAHGWTQLQSWIGLFVAGWVFAWCLASPAAGPFRAG